MRFFSFLATALSVTSLALSAAARSELDDEEIVVESDDVEPHLAVAAAWPEDNPFGHVVNGEKNTIGILLENRLNRNTSLVSVGGAFYQPETEILVKNLSSLSYGIDLIEGVKLQLPFSFYSEFKPGDLRLTIWVEHTGEEEGKERVVAYDSIVTIVEPEGSWFDFKLISTYLVSSALAGALAYIAYLSFVPQPKKSRKIPVSAPVGTVTATGAGGYSEEWIPEHHLRKSKKKSGALSSGDELSGGETSGTEGKRRKGRK